MPGAIYSVKTFDGTDVYVKARLASTIQFTDGTPIIERLEEIKSEIAHVLEKFKPEFQGISVGAPAPTSAKGLKNGAPNTK
jgi:Holliday junction resolvasome RuvABC endonuclease subunit